MRVGMVRSDISRLYIADLENKSQRCASAQSVGQTLYLTKPTDTQLTAVLASYSFVTVRGSNTAAAVDTTVSNGTLLKIRTSSVAAYTTITMTSSATAAKTVLVTDLNTGFVNAGLPLVARISGTNQITIDSTQKGVASYIEITATGAAFHTAVGLTAAATTGLAVSALKTAVYPSATTVDVSSVTILALSTFSLMLSPAQTALVAGIADAVAPKLVETGPVLLSFVYGQLSKLRSASFQPGGSRGGLTAGVGAVIVQDDGSSVFLV